MPEWRITDIVSQTDVLRCLAVHLDSGGSLDDDAFDWPLSRLGLVTGDVATVTGSTPTLSGALGGGGAGEGTRAAAGERGTFPPVAVMVPPSHTRSHTRTHTQLPPSLSPHLHLLTTQPLH